MVEVLFVVARLEAFAAGRRLVGRGTTVFWNSIFMNMNIGFVFMHQGARRLRRARVVMLVHAVVVNDHGVARFPVVADAVVDFVAFAVEDVERRLVHVPMLLVLPVPGVLLEMHVQRLRSARRSAPCSAC